MRFARAAVLLGVLAASVANAQDSTTPKLVLRQASNAAISTTADIPTKAASKRILAIYDATTYDSLPNVQLRDLLSDFVHTTATGMVSLGSFVSQHDTVAIQIRKIGYKDTVIFATVTPEDTLPVMVTLQHIEAMADTSRAAILDPMVVTSGTIKRTSLVMQDFESRRNFKGYNGRFITPEELRGKWAGHNVVEALRVSGSQFTQGKRNCQPRYIVNGALGPSPVKELPLADAYEAIEVYPDPLMLPIQFAGFNTDHTCNVIVMWLRGS